MSNFNVFAWILFICAAGNICRYMLRNIKIKHRISRPLSTYWGWQKDIVLIPGSAGTHPKKIQYIYGGRNDCMKGAFRLFSDFLKMLMDITPSAMLLVGTITGFGGNYAGGIFLILLAISMNLQDRRGNGGDDADDADEKELEQIKKLLAKNTGHRTDI